MSLFLIENDIILSIIVFRLNQKPASKEGPGGKNKTATDSI